ncbi:DUF6428 family protein [Aequorivita sp. SDUM287046]|uniref:DUF6428 family protein n=1 Tax=Aequorivita aurantiaca TaxID=3053356 RepID=A0ABT8DQD3_9FLAO|nr:DUF6428 family protein [Aequorivita aurantiaca]MDN3725453.1 DUF6428 family protein [Aequorivita aurantiaca]
MKLSEIKNYLSTLDQINFMLPNGELVPTHFHVTEVGKITKHFIDCGGTVRQEEVANFQLWNANDYNHRLHPEKLAHIIELSEKVLGLEDLEIEVEYQISNYKIPILNSKFQNTNSGSEIPNSNFGTIGKFGLDFDGTNFLLTSLHADCLAKENCGTPAAKPKRQLAAINDEPCCSPDGNCC